MRKSTIIKSSIISIQYIRWICFRTISILSLSVICLSFGNNAGALETESGTSTPAETLSGIDVSEFQSRIDWQAVKASGVTFAFARALYGESIHDPEFVNNWQGMKEAGVIRGAYDFYIVEESPASQVQDFSDIVSLESEDLAPMVDIEEASITASDGTAPANIVSNFHEYLILMEAHYGIKPIIYTNPSFWNEYMDDSFGDYPLWIAEYGVKAPTVPNGWDNWTIWQHSESGSIDGIKGSVDLDVFNGNLERLGHYRK